MFIGPEDNLGRQGHGDLPCSAGESDWAGQGSAQSSCETTNDRDGPASLGPGFTDGLSSWRPHVSVPSLLCLDQPQRISLLNKTFLSCVADFHINLKSPFMFMLFTSQLFYRVCVPRPSPMTQNLLAATYFSFLRLVLLTKWSLLRLPQKSSKLSMIQPFGCIF